MIYRDFLTNLCPSPKRVPEARAGNCLGGSTRVQGLRWATRGQVSERRGRPTASAIVNNTRPCPDGHPSPSEEQLASLRSVLEAFAIVAQTRVTCRTLGFISPGVCLLTRVSPPIFSAAGGPIVAYTHTLWECGGMLGVTGALPLSSRAGALSL